MNKKLVFLLVAFFAATIGLKAQDYKTGLGVRLSTAGAVVNNAITFKYFLNEKSAIEAQFAFGDPTALGVLYEVHKPLNNTEGLKWFYGGGGYIGFSKPDPLLGAQGVVGLDYKFPNLPLNLSLDWKPELNIAPDINFEASALGLSIRFTFNSR
ncbi:MAG: hypothetical protein JNN29_01700 [Chitinophagaceae bacterium]|nr:hypothetical protein [Chitinophagaceae bacterium]MBN8668017.1 hypothetical protein [Chitinophagales bacterium]